MMLKQKFMILCSLLFIFESGNAQFSQNWATEMIAEIKIDIYKKIILSEELSNDRKCHIVTIPSTSLDMNYHSGFVNFISDIEESQDTISKQLLSNDLSSNYWIYYIEVPIDNVKEGASYMDLFHKSDTTKMSIIEELCLCQDSYDIIRIYEPFDKWMNIYISVYQMNYRYETVIPVKYESLNEYKDIIKEEYYLFKISNDIIDGKFQMVKNTVKLE